MTSFWPVRIFRGSVMLLARASSPTEILYFFAIPSADSPSATVWMPPPAGADTAGAGATGVAAGADNGAGPPAAGSLALPGICSVWPILSMSPEMPLSARIAPAVVPWRAAILESVSPDFTV